MCYNFVLVGFYHTHEVHAVVVTMELCQNVKISCLQCCICFNVCWYQMLRGFNFCWYQMLRGFNFCWHQTIGGFNFCWYQSRRGFVLHDWNVKAQECHYVPLSWELFVCTLGRTSLVYVAVITLSVVAKVNDGTYAIDILLSETLSTPFR